ncbi:MAG: MFS transporter [Alphaproteobacteria bacterium]|nr:MFS transporter [Alphaproteobacteria bacterium]
MSESTIPPQRTPDHRRQTYVVIGCALAIVAIAVGIQQTFGLFMLPISQQLGWGREVLSLALATQALMIGVATPFLGAIADKWGAPRVMAAGGALYALGVVLMSQSTSPTAMFLSAGFLVGIAAATCGMPMVLSVVGRNVSAEKRSMWLGTVTACGTLGQFLVVPFSQRLIGGFGWVAALIVLAFVVALIIPLAFAILRAGKGITEAPSTQRLGEALLEARSHSGYVMLIAGFFVCGFQVRFIAAHLPAYLGDLNLTAELAATALVVIAVFNGIGSWGFGYLGGRYRKKYLLCWLYGLRSVAIYLFISTPASPTTVLIFSAVIGLLWLGTVPLTSGIVAQIFGTRYMATLYGIVFLGHQLGSFLGVWLGGRLFDATGSYQSIWWISIGLGLAAVAVHAAINDTPMARMQAARSSTG